MGVPTVFAVEPTVATSTPFSPLYVVWTTPNPNPLVAPEYQFLRGDDNGAQVDFSPVEYLPGVPIGVQLQEGCADCDSKVPGDFIVKCPPHLAADPTDPDRLYFLYVDEGAVDGDLDVFCVRLDRSAGFWTATTPAVRVNDNVDGPNDHSDQFCTDLAVDDAGRVHVVFYDDRNYPNQQDTDTEGRFDVYYAYSVDGGQTFSNHKLAGSPDEPALDTYLVTSTFTPREYPGIATFANEVWIAFTGTYSGDATQDKSVVYVTRVDFN